MVWIKSHQVLSYFLFSLVAFCLFFLLGPSSSCSAASQSITITYSDINSYNDSFYVWYKGDTASESRQSILSFRPVYVEITGVNEGGSAQALQLGYRSVNSNAVFLAYGGHMSVSLDLTSFSTDYAGDYVLGSNRSNLMYYIDRDGRSLTFTFYDSVPEGCPEPDPCPEIPETPYGDKLDKIYNAIMIGSATLLVIYFFFIMFKWYLGGQ